MEMILLKNQFSVCQVEDFSQVNFEGEYIFTAQTPEEKSLVCISGEIPENCIQAEAGWKELKIEGVLDFSLKGILYRISRILYDEDIGIFVVSTYNTDYIFVKEEDVEAAVNSLEKESYKIKREA